MLEASGAKLRHDNALDPPPVQMKVLGAVALPWMPIYWGDYFRDTLEFSTFQHGCYLLLIGAYWSRGGPLPNDPAALAKICRTSGDKLARYGNPVLAKFTCKDGLLRHERIEKELLTSSGRQAAAQANGRAGGLAKSYPTTPTPIEERKKVTNDFFVGKNGLGSGRVTILDPSERLSRFQAWLAKALGSDGWGIVIEAQDPAHPNHRASLAICQAKTKAMGKGWPNQWPT